MIIRGFYHQAPENGIIFLNYLIVINISKVINCLSSWSFNCGYPVPWPWVRV